MIRLAARVLAIQHPPALRLSASAAEHVEDVRPRSSAQECVSFGRAAVLEVWGGRCRALTRKTWSVAGIVAGNQSRRGVGRALALRQVFGEGQRRPHRVVATRDKWIGPLLEEGARAPFSGAVRWWCRCGVRVGWGGARGVLGGCWRGVRRGSCCWSGSGGGGPGVCRGRRDRTLRRGRPAHSRR